jgi:signal transduction histidine kinase/ligand-binding sensor domain-containing protein
VTSADGWARTAGLVGLLATAIVDSGRAMDSHPPLSQYLRDRWGAERGFPGATVQAISQTPDGYLWIGTDKGLFRFDGIAFEQVPDRRSDALAIPQVLGLTADATGSLWMRLGGPRLARYHRGRVESVTALEANEDSITAMAPGRDGTLLMAGVLNGVMRWTGPRFAPLEPQVGLGTRSPILSLGEGPDGTVWVGTEGDGLFRLAARKMTRVPGALPGRRVSAVLPVGPRDVWIATDGGVVRWNGTEITARGLDPALSRRPVTAIALDRESNLWLATAGGLMRVDAGGLATRDAREGGDAPATAMFEDREGGLWIGRKGEIERLRHTNFTTFGTAQGLPSDHNGPILVEGDGRVWLAPLRGGLFWLKDGHVGEVRADGLSRDVVYSIAAGREGVWLGRLSGAVTRISLRGDVPASRTYRAQDGLPARPVYAVHEGRDGTVWAGTLGGGLSRLKEGRFTTYTTADGLASDTITSVMDRADGSTWVATPSGLSAFVAGRWRLYATRDGLPATDVHCLFEDSAGTLWIGTGDGLAFLDAGRVRVPAGSTRWLREQVFGLAEDAQGGLWVATSRSVLRVRRDALYRGLLADGDVVQYGAADGLQGTAAARRHRSVVADAGGRIWFSMDRGLSVVDPVRAAAGLAPVPSHIQSLSADGTSLELSDAVTVPSAPHRVTLSYSAVSLSAPDVIRYRYRLDGFDEGWSEPVTHREAVYTNLGPGTYRFRVTASNRDGQWQGSEAALGLVIPPTLWQTGWVRLLLGLGAVLTLGLLYRLRLHRITREMTVRFDDRLEERARIARDLHDTLLQDVTGLLMRFHAVSMRVARQEPVKQMLDKALDRGDEILLHARETVHGLRTASGAVEDLSQALTECANRLAVGEASATFALTTRGSPWRLRQIIRDEIFQIGKEAVHNAFTHGGATRIDVDLSFDKGSFVMVVRDDGCGIAPAILQAGRREGHWGLVGMRERAERAGGRLKISSSCEAGTVIELKVPARIAAAGPESSAHGSVRPDRARPAPERP